MKINGYEIVGIEINKYFNNKNTAISLLCKTSNNIEPFATITVNFDVVLKEDLAFLDTNNCPWVERFIQDYELGCFADNYMYSGFCKYPLYKLNLSKIREFDKKLK